MTTEQRILKIRDQLIIWLMELNPPLYCRARRDLTYSALLVQIKGKKRRMMEAFSISEDNDGDIIILKPALILNLAVRFAKGIYELARRRMHNFTVWFNVVSELKEFNEAHLPGLCIETPILLKVYNFYVKEFINVDRRLDQLRIAMVRFEDVFGRGLFNDRENFILRGILIELSGPDEVKLQNLRVILDTILAPEAKKLHHRMWVFKTGNLHRTNYHDAGDRPMILLDYDGCSISPKYITQWVRERFPDCSADYRKAIVEVLTRLCAERSVRLADRAEYDRRPRLPGRPAKRGFHFGLGGRNPADAAAALAARRAAAAAAAARRAAALTVRAAAPEGGGGGGGVWAGAPRGGRKRGGRKRKSTGAAGASGPSGPSGSSGSSGSSGFTITAARARAHLNFSDLRLKMRM